ncbi:whole genome shotgun sequence [Seminavis robusta]|uniref:Whole genome shotgun sequence n=1 Tax=Seminavis robusta TaxID=568900 RepID=A0A9N8H3X8_9STRA|nr:whole genome shotgun sequence [Seminavis robusta]|eukprot:Sro48_g028320.1 whole genome shotgun sequence (314) ;mRNA; f:93739-94825
MASDDKLRCAIVYRLEGAGPTAVTLAQLDYLKEVETHKKDSEGDLYGGKKANFAKAVARVVGNDPPTGVSQGQKVGGFKVVQSDEHQVVYGADLEGICYCVITGLKYPNRIAIKFLEELGEEFQKTIGHDALKKAKEDSLTSKKDSKKILQAMCKKFETPASSDKTHKVLAQVDKVKEQMQGNIAGMMKNQESAESLNEKSAQLNEQAAVFKKNSKTLKKTMWWKNMKTTLALGCVLVIVAILLLLPIITNVGSFAAMVTGGGGETSESDGGRRFLVFGGDADDEVIMDNDEAVSYDVTPARRFRDAFHILEE